MLPVVEADGRSTARQIILYSVALIPVTLVPTFLGMAGMFYAACAVLLGLAMLYFAVRLAHLKAPITAAISKQRARQLLQATVFYLPILFLAMMLNSISS
jgi:protoheme IX farnesyltransferase